MNWMVRLYETYESSKSLDCEPPWPLSHFEKNAHVEVVIDQDGNFKSGRATVLSGEESPTIIPATESSAGRAGAKIAPHPLCEELGYCAGDLPKGDRNKNEAYMKQLKHWVDSEYTHTKAAAIFTYLQKNSLWADLSQEIDFPISFKSRSGQTSKINAPKVFVRWRVETRGEPCSSTWDDADLMNKWIEFDEKNNSTVGFCSIKGSSVRVGRNHSRFIRFPGDGAKLVSSNDQDGYTFRGRFLSSDQAADVGFEVTQKAHNALRWLIGPRKQAYRNGDQVIVSWAVSGKDVPNPMELPMSLDDSFDYRQPDDDQAFATSVDTTVGLGQQFAIALKKHMAGYYQKFEETPLESVVVMGLDSATPGRMAITYYRDFMAKEYLDVINQWYADFAWPQRIVKEYVDSKGKERKQVRWLPAAPTPWVILNACYGDVVKSNDSLKKQVSERLLPCILESHPLPRDLLQLAQHRASNPNSGERWEWERNVGVACALYCGFYKRHPIQSKRRNYPMSLDTENNSRDYLYGRLLALAERLEEVALHAAGQERPTAANRLMQRFADRPYETWLVIYKQLEPYIRQLKSSRPGFLFNINQEMDQVMCQFERDDYMNPGKLTGEYLLGFHCQRLALRKNRKADESNQTTEIQE